MKVKRVFVEKKKGYDVQAIQLFDDLKYNLGINALESVRLINRYDIEGLSDNEYKRAKNTILSEPNVDYVYDESLNINDSEKVFAIEYLPGQYDQRADSASQCIQILTRGERPKIKVAKLIVLRGGFDSKEYKKIKEYCINPVESREASLEKPETLETDIVKPDNVKSVIGFNNMSYKELEELAEKMGFAMSIDDLDYCRRYFRNKEKRDPTVTELRVLDTYWSDHCRHTTFMTLIKNVKFENGPCMDAVKSVYKNYLKSREFVYGDKTKGMCLMDIATIGMKELRKKGMLDDLEISDEVNACSIIVNIDVDGVNEEWLIMFKNETHNHPTEIEPFGGAATCLGGAIRDPLSGRSYVYQAMRVTGSGDPRKKIEDTLPGKLSQRKITTGAAAGYSSYGNQIGLSTGQVVEIFDEDFIAKRMEIGAVIAATPRKNVLRKKPEPGDAVILLGGRTGRDGCGGATGSSKEHTEESLASCGAEVQKGNPLVERKIQRLFRKPEVSRLIKKCNDFGAGGVSVAVGELADGLDIDLDVIPKKYKGLDGTELAISESQERMAVMVSNKNIERFIEAAAEENLEATKIADVTDSKRLKMVWRKHTIVDISREFLDTNGVSRETCVSVVSPDLAKSAFKKLSKELLSSSVSIKKSWLDNLGRLNVAGQKGLVEMFDSSIGAGTILMPFGGRFQLSPQEGMAAKIPVQEGDTNKGTLMSFGYNPKIAKWSPFHGAVYAIIESIAKIAAMGGYYKNIRLTLQEYFEKLGNDPKKWSKPFCTMLGAYMVQNKLGIPAIGGKDSMSGSFGNMNVPPTLVAFAVCTVNIKNVISTEFKKTGSSVVLLPVNRDSNQLPDFNQLEANYRRIFKLSNKGKILAAHSVRYGGIAEAISKMCFGNRTGFSFNKNIKPELLFSPDYGSILLEIDKNENINDMFKGLEYKNLGVTCEKSIIEVNDTVIPLENAINKWTSSLEKVFPATTREKSENPKNFVYNEKSPERKATQIVRPKVFMPVFPGTNCEYDTKRSFEKAGADVDILVVRNLTQKDITHSINKMVEKIEESQIIMIPGGFSGGDEPDGSGKFIATAFRNAYIEEAVMNLLIKKDGLILGICNGFQALIKLGLVPYGKICDIQSESPTLTFNTIGRHVSCMVRTKVVSNLSPWLWNVETGDIHTIPVSHGEGRFAAGNSAINELVKNGQIATQYVDLEGNPTYDIRYNPNGSISAVEGITSPDGRVFGKMGHNERTGNNIARNIPGNKDQKIFEAGVRYFN